MIKTNKFVPVALGIMVVASILGPVLIPVSQAATFNQTDNPYKMLRGYNYTDNGSCSSCWVDNNVSADIGDTVTFRTYFYVNSTSDAEDVTVRIWLDSISSDGKTAFVKTRVAAGNAGAVTDTVKVNISSGEITGLEHTGDTFLYDFYAAPVSLAGDEGDVVESSGLDLGTVEAGLINARQVVARFEVEGDDDEEPEENGELEVTTENADNIDEDSARLRCEVDTGDADADVWFEWGEDDDDLDEDTSKVSVGDNKNNVTVTKTITGLDEDTKYFFRCVAEDDDGDEDEGSVRSFTTDDDDDDDTGGRAPSVETLAATGIDNISATINGDVDPNDEDTDAWFEWGTSRTNLNRRTSVQDVGNGDSDVRFSARLTGLTANTTYFYRAVAENDEGDDEGSIRSFTTTLPVVNVVTRFIDIFRTVEVEEEPEEEVLIVTLEANAVDVDRRIIDYTVSYDNRTSLTLTDAILTIEMPRELDFEDSDPNPDDEDGSDLIFEIGTIRPGEEDSFLIETTLDNGVDQNDEIRFVARVAYNDDGSARKVVEVIDESTFGEISSRAGTFTAAVIDALRDFFTNPLLWLIVFIALIIFAVRYLLAARDRRGATLV